MVFNADGSFIYTPSADFFGTDSVSYVVTHTATGQTDTALLTIKVENDFELLEEYGWGLSWSDEFDTDNVSTRKALAGAFDNVSCNFFGLEETRTVQRECLSERH